MKKKVVTLLLTTLLLSCNKTPAHLSLLLPAGSPLLTVAGVSGEVEQEVTVGPDLIPAAFTTAEKDLIVAPIIISAKLFNANKSNYQLAAMLGWGNLHILSRTPINDINDLSGKKGLAFAEHSTPGIMFKLATSDVSDINVTYVKAVSDVGGPFMQKQYDYVLISEPVLSKIRSNVNDETYTFSLQNVAKLPKIAQFGLFSNPKTKAQDIDNFLIKLDANVTKLNSDPEGYVDEVFASEEYFAQLGRDTLISAIPRLDIEYKSALDAKEQLTAFFEYLISVDTNLIGAKSIDESFYRA